jgi:hypothetical protein
MKTIHRPDHRTSTPHADPGPWLPFADLMPGLRWRRHLARVPAPPAATPGLHALVARRDYGAFSIRGR